MTSVTVRTSTYIDGESHFQRSLAAWRRLTGDKRATLSEAVHADTVDNQQILVEPSITAFWSKRFSPQTRCLYFTACSGDFDADYKAKVLLQGFSLEPNVIREGKNLKNERALLLESHRIIEKPKGVDAMLFVQLLEDAHADRFDDCHVYTSDADYAPAIAAVKRMGKQVIVFGFDNDLGDRSPLRHAGSPRRRKRLALIRRSLATKRPSAAVSKRLWATRWCGSAASSPSPL